MPKSDDNSAPPNAGSKPKSPEAQDRLAAALRANLLRRKTQQRGRAADADETPAQARSDSEAPARTP
ncbi:MAG: hypothetical protein SFV21_15925 [Rhodospirillaceae bacterium]|nr:hypothetical protein [Rhodospirillaceae bacterium]